MIKKCVNLRQLKINFLNIHLCKKKKKIQGPKPWKVNERQEVYSFQFFHYFFTPAIVRSYNFWSTRTWFPSFHRLLHTNKSRINSCHDRINHGKKRSSIVPIINQHKLFNRVADRYRMVFYRIWLLILKVHSLNVLKK